MDKYLQQLFKTKELQTKPTQLFSVKAGHSLPQHYSNGHRNGMTKLESKILAITEEGKKVS